MTDTHLGRLVAAAARAQGQRPFVTFTDGASGERTELGGATFENWTAKAANLLVEELGLAPGDVLGVDLGTHWTAMVIQAAAWRAGVVLALPGAWAGASAVAVREGAEPHDEPVAGARLLVGDGFGGRLQGPAGDAVPFGEEVLGFPDDFDDVPDGGDAPALVPSSGAPRSHAALLQAADDLAARAGLTPGDRYASTVAADDEQGVVAGVVLALHLGGGVLLVRSTPPDRLAALVESERCSAVLTRAGDGTIATARR